MPDVVDRLPAGQVLVIDALLNLGYAPTYPEVARLLECHLGTVHAHLARVRARQPDLYAWVMATRARQLAIRHAEALARDAAHSAEWHRSQNNRRFYYRFGHWPWQRRSRSGR
jgi:hypothetical protein